MTKKKPNATTGRPKQYDEDMLRSIISELREAGVSDADIDDKTVKPLLCEKHGVSESVNTGSLSKHVETVLRAVLEEERQALLSSLPVAVSTDVDSVVSRMKQDILLTVARQNTVCQREAETECEVLRQDKANANWRIAELEAEAARLEAQIAELEDANAAREKDLSSAREEIAALQAKLCEQGDETKAVSFLLGKLRDPDIRRDICSVLTEVAKEPDSSEAPS